jgi:hypothetical protein
MTETPLRSSSSAFHILSQVAALLTKAVQNGQRFESDIKAGMYQTDGPDGYRRSHPDGSYEILIRIDKPESVPEARPAEAAALTSG